MGKKIDFERLLGKLAQVPKTEVERAERASKAARARKRRRKKK